MIRRAALALFLIPATAHPQGTKLWTTSRYEEMERGTTQGVAIRGDGRLEPGPAVTPLATTEGNYIWSLATDPQGTAYAGLGGTAQGSAAILKITPDGKTTKIFTGTELAVQAIRTLPNGDLLAATSPDGKLYRIPAAGGSPTVLFDPATTPEKPKYLWDIAIIGKTAYLATGAPAAVYTIDLDHPTTKLLFKTADQHIRSLLAAPDGTIWAGSDGAGVIYKMKPTDPEAKPFAVYTAARREITALALGPDGTIYAAGVGAKAAPSLPPLPVTGAIGISITFLQPGSATAASSNTLIPEGSEIDRIAPDGQPARLIQLKDDAVYALAVQNGALIAATGNRGRVYRIGLASSGAEILTDLAHLEAAQAMALAPTPGGLIAATSNSGKLFKLTTTPPKDPTYTSEVFDAQQFSRWGRPEVHSPTPSGFDLFVRTGNVPNPIEGWTDWKKITPNVGPLNVPDARYLQWKAVLRPSGSLASVAFNYLPRNVAPIVDDVVVAPGARVAPGGPPSPNQTIQVAFPTANIAQALSIVTDAGASPLTAQKDRTGITIRWSAHDDNGDDLLFAVWYRGENEHTWRLLKDKITDRFYSFDSALLPDGVYEAKVVASDAPVHVEADTLTGERTSTVFTIDTTPPVPGTLTARLEAGKVHVTFDAKDATSPIAHAEYALDGGPWQYLEPATHLSDSLAEHYDFLAPIPPPPAPQSQDHVIAIRIYDRFENMSGSKALVSSPVIQ